MASPPSLLQLMREAVRRIPETPVLMPSPVHHLLAPQPIYTNHGPVVLEPKSQPSPVAEQPVRMTTHKTWFKLTPADDSQAMRSLTREQYYAMMSHLRYLSRFMRVHIDKSIENTIRNMATYGTSHPELTRHENRKRSPT